MRPVVSFIQRLKSLHMNTQRSQNLQTFKNCFVIQQLSVLAYATVATYCERRQSFTKQGRMGPNVTKTK